MTLRNDATRQLIRPKDPRPLRDVVPRQGQVLLDADLDQAQRLILDRIERETSDMLGLPDRLAVPEGVDGFKVIAGAGPLGVRVRPGHGYLGGWRLDNAAEVQLDTQPHPRTGEVAAQPFALVVKALERFVDPVEEIAFADAALGDAEAAGRGLLDWQVLALPLAGAPTCATLPQAPEWLALTAPSNGTIGIKLAAAAPDDDPCSLLPQGGYSRLENLLYRIEVHAGVAVAAGPVADGPRFRLQGLRLKLSRSNASLMVPVAQVNGTTLVLSQPPRDPRRWFAPGNFAELLQSGDDLDPRPALQTERLFKVLQASDTQVVLAGAAADVANTGVAGNAGWYLRLWEPLPDAAGFATVGAPGGGGLAAEIPLGDGLGLIAGGGAAAIFRRGDFWTFAARADGTIDWPAGAVQEAPHGPNPRYAPLAVVSGAEIEDCRITFGRLTDPVLHYRGGDGQEAFPPAGGGMVVLAGKLRLQVLRGRVPVLGAQVEFRLPAGAQPSQVGGQAVGAGQSPVFLSDAQGLIELDWSIDAAAPEALHQVAAVLVAGTAGAADQPVTFTAAFRLAKQVAYQPDGCAILKGEDNVQGALDALCAAINTVDFPSLTLKQITLLDAKLKPDGELLQKDRIANGLRVPSNAFEGGIGFNFNTQDLSHLGFEPIDPIVEVSVDLPYPVTLDEKLFWSISAAPKGKGIPFPGPFGFQTIRLQGECRVDDAAQKQGFALIWLPSPPAQMFLDSLPLTLGGQAAIPDLPDWKPQFQPDLLVRLRLRSAHIWALDEKEKVRVYLNAEYLGVREGLTGRELALEIRDPQKAADLDCFFYLVLKR